MAHSLVQLDICTTTWIVHLPSSVADLHSHSHSHTRAHGSVQQCRAAVGAACSDRHSPMQALRRLSQAGPQHTCGSSRQKSLHTFSSASEVFKFGSGAEYKLGRQGLTSAVNPIQLQQPPVPPCSILMTLILSHYLMQRLSNIYRAPALNITALGWAQLLQTVMQTEWCAGQAILRRCTRASSGM